MNGKVIEYYSKITKYLKKLDKKKRNIGLFIISVCLIAAVISAFVLNHKNYVVLYSGLDTAECAEIVAKLDELGIESKVVNESTIYVDEGDEPSVKLKLAAEGYPKSTLNYDIFTGNIDFMTTDYEKTQYSLYQLQERLQASIETLDAINNAIVTITIPDNSLTVLDKNGTEASASVILDVKSGITLSEQQINGIEQLVAKSVPDLSADNISIIDQTGVILNNNSDDSISSASRITAENEISGIYSSRIAGVLSPLYGEKNISIGVNVIVDYDTKTTESSTYSPSKDNAGVVSKYDQTHEAGGSAASGGKVPGVDGNSEVIQYQTADTAGTDSSTVSDHVSVDYLVNQIIEQVQKQGAAIGDVTVSVLINKADMTPDEIANVTKIVANTAGVSTDKVALCNMQFATVNAPVNTPVTLTPGISLLSRLLSVKYLPIYALLSILPVFLIILFIIGRVRAKKRRLLKQVVSEDKKVTAKEDSKEGNVDVLQITETKEQQLITEIRDFSMKAPQITAMLIRTLLKGDFE